MKRIGGVFLSTALLLVGPAGEASYPRGGMVLIREIAASAQATVDFTAGIDDRFKFYVLEFWGVRPATDSVNLLMRVSTDNGSSWAASAGNYAYAMEAPHDGGTEANLHAGSNSDTSAALTLTATANQAGNAANEDINGWVKVYAPSDTTVLTRWRGIIEYKDKAGVIRSVDVMGTYNATTAVNGFRFLFSSGNITSGTFRLYGMP